MFVEKSQKRPPKFEVELWKREVGSLWLPFEKRKIQEFSRVKANERVNVDGFVKWIDNSVFALIPTPLSNQIHLVCVNNTNKKPSENSHVAISGMAKWHGIRRIATAPVKSRIYDADLVVFVDKWDYEKTSLDVPKTNFEFKDFKRDIASGIMGLEPKIVDFLAFTAISTPMFYKNIGGINLTLYDSTQTGLPKRVIRELSHFVPKELDGLSSVATPFGRFGMRYKFGFFTENADVPLTQFANSLLTNRTVNVVTQYEEASLSLFSAKDKPASIEDPPFKLSDIATTVSEGASISRTHDFEPDSFKYWLTTQMITPVIKDYDDALRKIQGKLAKLTESWGLDPKEVAKYGLLDSNYKAKPASIIRQCLAFERAQKNVEVDVSSILRNFDEYFKWNFENTYDVWEDFLKPNKINLISQRIENREIIRIMRKYEATGEIGVSEKVIISEAKTRPNETKALLEKCVKEGILYEPRKGFYRQVHD